MRSECCQALGNKCRIFQKHLGVKGTGSDTTLEKRCNFHPRLGLKLPQSYYMNMDIGSSSPSHILCTIITIEQNIKARKLQKSQFSNSLANWKEIGSIV